MPLFTLGYSHPIEFMLPDGIDMKVDKQTHIVLTGYDKQVLGQVAANMRSRCGNLIPYKNKGVRYTGEVLRKKVGKTGASEERSKRWLTKVSKNETRGPAYISASGKRLIGTYRAAAARRYSGRSNHTYAQVIDDSKGATVVSASTSGSKAGGNVEAARKIGAEVAQKAIERGIKRVVFDRGGYIYHGRVKALADAAREAGLEF